MEVEKDILPSYNLFEPKRRRRRVRRSRTLKFLVLACLGFIAYAQWRQISSPSEPKSLSIKKLQENLKVCAKLRTKPTDPIGLGRERNARYIDGHKPTLIKNATIWIGEPVEGTSAEDARTGKAYEWTNADVFLQYGLIKKVEKDIDVSYLSEDEYLVYNAKGRPLTSGIIDMHSHAGVDSQPELEGSEDTNEMSSDITPYVRSIDGLNPLDHQLQVIKSGGVTTSLILPGSGNNIGGEAYAIKHAVGKADGRNETSAADMLADPDHNWRYMKMACGENAKRVYGKVGEHGPVSRLGESWEFRHAFDTAAKLVQAQDDWCDLADKIGLPNMASYLPQDLKWESLAAVLRGQVHVNTHCYTIPDLEAFVDHTNEFKFPIRAFHHAHQTYLVPEILKRAYGEPPASALFADNMWYKAEAYIGSEYAGLKLWESGLTPIYVSDNPVLNAQHVVFEAAKAFGYGLPYHVAMASVTSAPAERLGLGNRLGKVKTGFDADVVVWDSDPMSVGAAPVQVWIDGTAQFEDPFELDKPTKPPASAEQKAIPVSEEPAIVSDVVYTGITTSLLSEQHQVSDGNLTVVISDGKIVCLGSCDSELRAASKTGTKIIHLNDGYITSPFVIFGSTLGLNTIDAEDATDNGASAEHFSRGIDGLRLDTKKLHYAHRYGVTKAISAPKLTGQMTHLGTSVGFTTGALQTLEKGAVWQEDVAAHYTLDDASKAKHGSVSAATGALRAKLLKAVQSRNESAADQFSEEAYLRKVVNGTLPLSLTANSADSIAWALRLKSEIEAASSTPLRLIILGGAESHLLASELAAAEVGVVLAPMLSYRSSWDQRRALTGAPLTNGTAVDRLVEAGVLTGIGIEEDWLVRDVGLLAGIAWRNSGGSLSEREALKLAGENVMKMLGLDINIENEEFVVFEGSPLEVGARVRGVDDGRGFVTVFE